MSKQRLSKLQIKILHALFTKGEDTIASLVIAVEKNNFEDRTSKEKEGYVFTNEFCKPSTNEPSGKLRYEKKLQTKRLRRSKLLFLINNWQEYNAYAEEASIAGICGWKKWQKGYPPFYKQQQVTFTRSIQTLAGAGYVDLLMKYEEPVTVWNDSLLAKKLGSIEMKSLDKEKQFGMERLKKDYLTAVQKQPNNPNYKTFDDFLDEKITPMFFGVPAGGETTRRHIFEQNYGRRNYRNTHWIRLTEKGLSKALELIVKYQTSLRELTIRGRVIL